MDTERASGRAEIKNGSTERNIGWKDPRLKGEALDIETGRRLRTRKSGCAIKLQNLAGVTRGKSGIDELEIVCVTKVLTVAVQWPPTDQAGWNRTARRYDNLQGAFRSCCGRIIDLEGETENTGRSRFPCDSTLRRKV